MIRKSIPFAFAAFLVAAFLAFSPHQSQAQGLGFAAGANFDDFSDIEVTDGRGTIDNATGFHVGLFYDFVVGPVSLRPGLFYVEVGEIQLEDGFQQRDFDLNLIEVPIDLRYRVGTPVLSPYVLAGPVLRFANADDDDFQDALNNFSVAGGVGIGLEIGVPGTGFRLYPELRYQFGVTRLAEDFEFLGANFTTESEMNLNAFMLRLGLTI